MRRSLIQTAPQRLGLLVAAIVSVCLAAYPAPAFYHWSNGESRWIRTVAPELHYPYYLDTVAERAERARQHKEELSRRFLLDYGMYERVRPDFRRMALEVVFVWLAGTCFAWAVKPSPPNRDVLREIVTAGG